MSEKGAIGGSQYYSLKPHRLLVGRFPEALASSFFDKAITITFSLPFLIKDSILETPSSSFL